MTEIKNYLETTRISFFDELNSVILPLYEDNEMNFDVMNIHGRIHIARSVIFAELMMSIYNNLFGINLLPQQIDAVRYSVAFHDLGREESGTDIWEEQSAEMCKQYLLQKNIHTDSFCSDAAGLIVKKDKLNSPLQQIVSDADVLEIMRPCCSRGGILGFNEKKLGFLSDDDFFIKNDVISYRALRLKLVMLAWKFITNTEKMKSYFQDKLVIEYNGGLNEKEYAITNFSTSKIKLHFNDNERLSKYTW